MKKKSRKAKKKSGKAGRKKAGSRNKISKKAPENPAKTVKTAHVEKQESRQPAMFLKAFKAVIATAIIVLLVFLIVRYGVKSDFDMTLEDIDALDAKYGTSLHDYDNGVAYLKYNPRYPNPINAAEFEEIIIDFEEVRAGLDPDELSEPSGLLVEARIALLEAEKFYKLATKTRKGLTSDGFSCGDMVFVQAATINFGSCVEHGMVAVDRLMTLAEDYPEQAEKVNVTMFWAKNLEMTFDYIEQGAKENAKAINKMCS